MSKTNKISRRFKGVFPPQNKFDKAHLNAYLRGGTYFNFGFTYTSLGARERTIHTVQQEYFERE